MGVVLMADLRVLGARLMRALGRPLLGLSMMSYEGRTWVITGKAVGIDRLDCCDMVAFMQCYGNG